MRDRAAIQKLYGSGRWRKRSKFQLAQEPFCRACAARGEPVPATVADHVFRHEGNPQQFWFGELQSLCRPCHDSRKKFAENRGFDGAVGIDGMPLDPRHPFYTGALPTERPRAPPTIDPIDGLIPE